VQSRRSCKMRGRTGKPSKENGYYRGEIGDQRVCASIVVVNSRAFYEKMHFQREEKDY